MKLQRRTPEDIDVNLTPMIDVIFLLLIFFLITATFKKTSTIEITLPKASDRPMLETLEPLEVLIDAQGNYYINQIPVTQKNQNRGALMQAIRQGASGNPQQPVHLKADGLTPHQAVITAMDALRQLGLTQLSVLTESNGSQTFPHSP